jgi:hypothetical protein
MLVKQLNGPGDVNKTVLEHIQCSLGNEKKGGRETVMLA